MERFLNFVFDNKEWLFSGLGIAVISVMIGAFKKKVRSEEAVIPTMSQSVTVNVGDSNKNVANVLPIVDKEAISILFIDDNIFDYVNYLKNAGYINVKRIRDVKQIDAPDIINANVIFVDVNGVGVKLFPKEQGLGVAKAIKKRFGEHKKVFLYSASHQELSLDFNILDGVLPKNADPYEFINLIDNIRNSR